MKTLTHYLLWSLGMVRPTTQTTLAERECLGRHAAGRRRIAEIGVWHGVTTCVLRRAMHQDGWLYAVDPFFVGRMGISFQRRIAIQEIGQIERGKVEWLRMTGAEAARLLVAQEANAIDFLFIDGDHSYEGLKSDWENWSALIAVGGLVALHDSRSSSLRDICNAGSVRYTNEIIRNDSRFDVIEEIDSLTVVVRADR